MDTNALQQNILINNQLFLVHKLQCVVGKNKQKGKNGRMKIWNTMTEIMKNMNK